MFLMAEGNRVMPLHQVISQSADAMDKHQKHQRKVWVKRGADSVQLKVDCKRRVGNFLNMALHNSLFWMETATYATAI